MISDLFLYFFKHVQCWYSNINYTKIVFINNYQHKFLTNLFYYQLQLINLVPSDFGATIIRQKAKWGGNTASSSENYSEDVPLFVSSDKEVVEETNSIDYEAPINKIPLKYKDRGKIIQEKRKLPFAYKPFKEDFLPVVNPRIELEKRKIIEKDKLIEGIYGSYSVQNGLSKFEHMNIVQKGIDIF